MANERGNTGDTCAFLHTPDIRLGFCLALVNNVRMKVMCVASKQKL